MPEGPEVAVVAHELDEFLVGSKIESLHYDDRSRYSKNGLVNLDLVNKQGPWLVEKVESRGKKIIFVMRNDVRRIYFVSSLGMEGRWTTSPTIHCNLWLNLSTSQKLYFCDSRHFGILEILDSEKELIDRLKKLGPDLLQDDISPEMWQSRCRVKKWNSKPIGDVMMDQDWFCGIGNYLRSEILYASKINPHRLIETLSNSELETVRVNSLRLIREAFQAQGATIYTFISFRDNKGKFEMQCYNRSTDNDGNPIIKDTMKGGRTMHWCPQLQS